MSELQKRGRKLQTVWRLFVLLIGVIKGLGVNQEMLVTSTQDGESLADSEQPCFKEPIPKLKLTLTKERI